MKKDEEIHENQLIKNYENSGWVALPFCNDLFNWAKKVKIIINQKINSMDQAEKDLRCGGTWFPGVNFLDNDPYGNVLGSTFPSDLTSLISKLEPTFSGNYDRAQISICYPGYPKPMDNESVSAFNYRINRFAAHIDGILPIGQFRRRFLKEHHAFIFGIPINHALEVSSPCVVWEGSHKVVQKEFRSLLISRGINNLQDQDVTEFYSSLRKKIFVSCKVKKVWVPLGHSYLIHRLTLHGIWPWIEDPENIIKSRVIAYFRPQLYGGHEAWLNL